MTIEDNFDSFESCLLRAYKKQWIGRTAVESIQTMDELKSAVQDELRDALAHPRARMNSETKLRIAIERITESSLTAEEQKLVIEYYTQQFEEM